MSILIIYFAQQCRACGFVWCPDWRSVFVTSVSPVFVFVLAGSRSCLMMLCARGLSGSDLSFYPVLITSRAQTTKWGVDSLDRHNTVLSGHQSSQLPPDKLRGLFVPSSSSDRVKFNHRKISCEKICLMIETLNWCKRWAVESEVEVIGIWNREQKVEPC